MKGNIVLDGFAMFNLHVFKAPLQAIVLIMLNYQGYFLFPDLAFVPAVTHAINLLYENIKKNLKIVIVTC
ncbi:hypothetical protein HPT25_14720 [Bacillus sp. BRMEA1]|nr:hypothetical protein [Neobacillus endophyticus]